MSVIRWQFYSLKTEPFNAIKFSGIDISVADFKDLVMKEKGMKGDTSKLVVIDASNNEEYTDDTDMIPRNKQVYIRKVPIKQVSGPLASRGTVPPDEAPTLTAKDLIDNKTVDLATANATEEDKLRAAMDQASQYYHPSQFTRTRGIRSRFQKPPPNYVCHSCGGKDHFRQQCPKGKGEAQAIAKRATGFPTSHLVGVSRQGPGVLRDSKGNLVIPRADVNILMPHTQNKAASDEVDVVEIPPELVCRLCDGLIRDAVIIPCCGENYCDECIRNHLLDHDFLCPSCGSSMSPDKLVINKNLRMYAQKFRSRLHPGAKLLAGKRVMDDHTEDAEQGRVTPPTQDGAVTKTMAETSARSSPVPSDTNTPCDSPQRGVASREDQTTPHGSPSSTPAISAPIVMPPQQQQQPHPLAQTTHPLPPTLPTVLAPTFMPRPVPYNPFQLTASGPTAGQGIGGILSSLVPTTSLTVSQPKRAITVPLDVTKQAPPPISKEMFLKLQTEARKKEIERLRREERSKRKRRERSESVSSRGSSPSRSPTLSRSRGSSHRRSPVLSRSRSPREPRKHHSSAKHKKRKSEKESHTLSSSTTSGSKHRKGKKHRSRSHSGSDASSSKRAKSSGATVSPIPESGMGPEVEPVSASGSNATTSRPVSPLLSPSQGEVPNLGHSVVNSPSYSSVEGESLLDESDNETGKSDTNVAEEGVSEADKKQVEGKAASHECESVAGGEGVESDVTAKQQDDVKEGEEEEEEAQCQAEEKTEPEQLVEIVVTEEEEDEYAQEEVGSESQTQPVATEVAEEVCEAVNGLEEGEIVEEEEKEKDMREVLSAIRKVNKTLSVQTDSKERKRKHKQKHSKKVVVKETSSSATPTESDDGDDSSDSSSDSESASYSDESPSSPSEDERRRHRRHKAKRRRVDTEAEKPRSSKKMKHSSTLSSSKKHSRKNHKELADGARESSRHRKEKRSRHERERHKDSRREKKRKKSKVRQSSEEHHRKHRTTKQSRRVKHKS